jgi:hypothetical protein
MANLRICSINFFDQAALTTTPAWTSSLPITNAQLVARESPARSTTNGDQVIEGDWGGNGRRIDSAFLFRHNGHGGKIRLQLFKYADRTVEIYNSGAVEIYPLTAMDNAEFGYAPLGFSTDDVLGPESPYSLFFTAVIAASFRITLTRCQNAYWEIGRVFLGKYREAPFNPKWGMTFGWQSTGKQTRTIAASLQTRAGERYRELKADMRYVNDSDRAVWRDLLGQIDLSEDVAISIFPGFGGRAERDGVFNAQLEQHSPFTWPQFNTNEAVFQFTEV